MICLEQNSEEMLRRKSIVEHAQKMIFGMLEIISQDETSIMTTYRDFHLQISFSELHPLMVFCLARPVDPSKELAATQANKVNLCSVLGCHCVNVYYHCYHFRATHWLDTKLTQARFIEMLERCADEANRGYRMIAS